MSQEGKQKKSQLFETDPRALASSPPQGECSHKVEDAWTTHEFTPHLPGPADEPQGHGLCRPLCLYGATASGQQ